MGERCLTTAITIETHSANLFIKKGGDNLLIKDMLAKSVF